MFRMSFITVLVSFTAFNAHAAATKARCEFSDPARVVELDLQKGSLKIYETGSTVTKIENLRVSRDLDEIQIDKTTTNQQVMRIAPHIPGPNAISGATLGAAAAWELAPTADGGCDFAEPKCTSMNLGASCLVEYTGNYAPRMGVCLKLNDSPDCVENQ